MFYDSDLANSLASITEPHGADHRTAGPLLFSSVRWSAPWELCSGLPPWMRWTLFAFALLVGYVESGVVTQAVLFNQGAGDRFESMPVIVYTIADAAYTPLWEACYYVPPLKVVVSAQVHAVSTLFAWLGL